MIEQSCSKTCQFGIGMRDAILIVNVKYGVRVVNSCTRALLFVYIRAIDANFYRARLETT
jgi:hypothetical protein